jgi:hypothetical protein
LAAQVSDGSIPARAVEALARIYPGEDGATGEIELRQVFELEGLDAPAQPRSGGAQ